MGGTRGVIEALPYAVWFYIGVEMLPFLSEDTRRVSFFGICCV